MMRIKICTPLYKDGCEHPEMLVTVDRLLRAHPDWSWARCVGPHIWRNRNNLVGGAGWTHYLFVDSDVSFGEETLDSLLSAARSIVGAAYQLRSDTERLEWCAGSGSDHLPMDISPELYRCDWVGAGALLVEAQVFEILERPWFRHEIIGEDCTPEDVGFCLHARCNGIRTYCDTRYPAMHHLEAR